MSKDFNMLGSDIGNKNVPVVNADENNLIRESLADLLGIPVKVIGLFNAFSKLCRV